MAKQAINVGFVANDNTGDFLRPAMIKINENFSELYDLLATLQDIAFTGEYDDLNNPPFIPEFDGSYNSLDDLPTLGTASAEDIEFFAVTARGLPSGGTTGQILSKVSGTDYDVEWVDNLGGGGSGIEAIVEDTSPQLGGNLDLNSFVITGMEIGTNIQAYSSILDATTASFTTDLENKLSDLPTLTELNALLLLKADLEDPIFTGIPTAPTASASDDSLQLATTAFVHDVLDSKGVPVGGTTGQALIKISGDDYDVGWGDVEGGGGGGLTEVVEDTTPQLGGDLDLNGHVITGMVIGTNIQAYSSVLAGTTASFTTALETKLNGIETAATADQTGSEMLTAIGGELVADDGLLRVDTGVISVAPGLPAFPASAEQIRQASTGFYTVTPSELDLAEELVTLTVTSDIVPVDAHDYWNGIATITNNSTVESANNLHNHPLRLRVVASGGDYTLTPDASYVLANFDGETNYTIPNGETALFLIEKVGADVVLTFAGRTG